MLYNQYLRTRMEDQLKRYEELEENYEEIRDICGTQDLEFIIDFIMLRNKRYNYAVQIVNEKEQKIKKLKKEIKQLNSDLVKLKNKVIVNEKDQDSKTETTVESSGMEQEEIEMMKKENEKNQDLIVLGKKYNEINLAYNKILENIQAMKEYDQAHPLDIKEEDLKKEEEKEAEEEKKVEKDKKKIKLTQEEEECINEYEKLLKKVLKAFNILYLCKSKQEFLNLMKEKGINQHMDNKSSLNKQLRTKTKRVTKRNNKTERHAIKADVNENKNNDDEEDDISNFDPDKKILTKFVREQKKEIDEFINVKKPPTNTTKPAGSK